VPITRPTPTTVADRVDQLRPLAADHASLYAAAVGAVQQIATFEPWSTSTRCTQIANVCKAVELVMTEQRLAGEVPGAPFEYPVRCRHCFAELTDPRDAMRHVEQQHPGLS
jgi:hypothetical protein